MGQALRQREFALVADTRDAVGESPVWLAGEKRLVWTDIAGRRLHKLDPLTHEVATWRATEAVGSIARAADGGFIAATEKGFARLTLGADETACLDPVAPVLEDLAHHRFNDGRCDRQGRFWASSMAWAPDQAAPAGGLWRLDRDVAAQIWDGLIIGNGLCWSPDGRTMYLAESHVSRPVLWVFDFDIDSGVPHNRRLFADFKDSGGRPDGAAIDSEACVWVAVTDQGLVRRYTPDGRVDLTIAVPVAHPTMPTFGGDDMRTLFVTSLRGADAPADRPDGGVFAVEVSQQGLADEPYRS